MHTKSPDLEIYVQVFNTILISNHKSCSGITLAFNASLHYTDK